MISGENYVSALEIWKSMGVEIHYDENGYFHRIDGPAYTDTTNKDGAVDPANKDKPGFIYQLWYIHGSDITDEVEKWMKDNNIAYPFDDEAQTLFILRFC